MIIGTEKRRFERELTEAERRELDSAIADDADTMQRFNDRVEAHKADAKELAGLAKKRSEALATRLSERRSGRGQRDVECVLELDGSQVFVRRADTGEVVHQRAATQAETQRELPLTDDAIVPAPTQDLSEVRPDETPAEHPMAQTVMAAAESGAASVEISDGDRIVRFAFDQSDVVNDNESPGSESIEPVKPARKRGKR